MKEDNKISERCKQEISHLKTLRLTAIRYGSFGEQSRAELCLLTVPCDKDDSFHT